MVVAQILGETRPVRVHGRLVQRGAGRRSLRQPRMGGRRSGILRDVGMGELVQAGCRAHGRRRRLLVWRRRQMVLLLVVHGDDKTREGREYWLCGAVVTAARFVVCSTSALANAPTVEDVPTLGWEAKYCLDSEPVWSDDGRATRHSGGDLFERKEGLISSPGLGTLRLAPLLAVGDRLPSTTVRGARKHGKPTLPRGTYWVASTPGYSLRPSVSTSMRLAYEILGLDQMLAAV